mmetsp:Transcript_26101/g.40104  ORF Transcript_26101/g.40104 Transcript_26101/m.40104 type:complete len:367 (-) Transcript_26101:75-1175(-)
MIACLPSLFHFTAWSTASDGSAIESWMSYTSLNPAGSSSSALGTSDATRLLMWCSAITDDAAYRTAQGSSGESLPPHLRGTSTPRLASNRTHSLPPTTVPAGHSSHCSDDVENTKPVSQSMTSCGNCHARSPPGHSRGSLLSRTNDPCPSSVDCQRNVGSVAIVTAPSVPVTGRMFLRIKDMLADSLSPFSSNSTHPDAPSNDTLRIAVSSRALSTDPSSATPTLLMAMAAVQTASYMAEQYWSQSPSERAVYVSDPCSEESLRCSNGSLISASWNREWRLPPYNRSSVADHHPDKRFCVAVGSGLPETTPEGSTSKAVIHRYPAVSIPWLSAKADSAAKSCRKIAQTMILTPESAIWLTASSSCE